MTAPDRGTSVTLAAAKARAERTGRHAAPYQPPPPKKLSDAEREQALEVIRAGGASRLCGGIHYSDDVTPELACPRLASFRLDGDGRVAEGTYWRDGEWDTSQVIRAADAAEDTDDGPA